MAIIKSGFGPVNSFVITNLNSLATSPTAGWRSAAVDNSEHLYLDYAVQFILAAVDMPPANSKEFRVYFYSQVDISTTDWTTTGAISGGDSDGTEGLITFPDFTTNAVNHRFLGTIPYVGQNTIIVSDWFSVLSALGGVAIPQKFGFSLINHSGMTIAPSGNSVKGIGIYNLVA